MSTPVAGDSEALMTAEDFGDRPDPGYPEELVRGRIARRAYPLPRHGQICARLLWTLGRYLDGHDLGHLIINVGIVTERGPDTVRGADLLFFSYERIPRGRLPEGYGAVPPELVIEVRNRGERWAGLLAKVAEYLDAGVLVVAVVDDERDTVQVFDAEHGNRVLSTGEELEFPTILPGFSVFIERLFE